jgi:hypothetical protein
MVVVSMILFLFNQVKVVANTIKTMMMYMLTTTSFSLMKFNRAYIKITFLMKAQIRG